MVALTHPARKTLAPTFVVARSHSRPGAGVVWGRKAVHVGTHLGYDDFGDGLAHARDRVKMLDCCLKRETSGLNLVVERLDAFFQGIDERQQVRSDEALRVGEASGEGLFKQSLLVAKPPLRQLRRIAFSGHQGLQHRATRNTQDIRGDGSELDIGPFQQLLEAIAQVGALANECGAIAYQLPQLPLGCRRYKTGFEKAHLQEFGQPLSIFDVGFASGHVLKVPGVDQKHRKLGFQQVVDRLPIDARTLDGDMSNLPGAQPIREAQQIGSEGGIGAHFDDGLVVAVLGQPTRDDVLLMDIQSWLASVTRATRACNGLIITLSSGNDWTGGGILTNSTSLARNGRQNPVARSG